MKTQRRMYDDATARIAERDELFMEMIRGPNPLTPEEIDRLIERDPARYGRYAKFGAKGRASNG